ncbi:hypothetical protein MPTK1_7g01080 [Marchantia polymorpha subsp. ruderalis]|uniref:Uncharacterized protein n=2 Tax=Marchantia polymorpha TaxID=3197 RepID=A0AAF6BUY0_MARPO|nr:hypothetical protein MARPO_0046s0016 [Marchantia polymorpha]BBN15814.1 hypothetical protein Mp_7g01080 [Marchantia polymorpha subsp. ruderalis]|eukprot:PTQ39192.1 hypothetical protein MARPO_0046s0016 [Marchantia polymorpha]
MEENVRSLVVGKNEEDEEEEEEKKKKKKRDVVNENCLEGKQATATIAAVLPCGTKVKSEPPEDDCRERGLPRVAVDGAEGRAAEAEDVKIKPPGPEDRVSSKVQDAIPPCVDGVGSSSNNIDSSINVVHKEELENIELNSLGESSLAKLKRRIRLRLLAEEARNSIARKAELAAVEDAISIPSSRITTRTRSSELSSRAPNNNYPHDEKPVIAPAPAPALPLKSRNRIVNLSSESEDENPIPRKTESEPSQLVVEKDHPPAAASAENSYFEALQRLLGPLLSAVGPTDSSTSMSAAEAAAARKPGRPARRSPRGSKATESVSSLVNILKKRSAAAAAAAAAGDEGRPKRSNRRSKPRERERERREASGTQDSALEYEQERADNIRRNKEFLAQLGLSSTLHSMSAKRKSKRGRLAGSKSQAAAAAAAAEELYENSKHHNVEEIMLQLCALRAAAAAAQAQAQAQSQALGIKRPRLFDPSDNEGDEDDDEYVEDDDDEDEDEDGEEEEEEEEDEEDEEDEEGHGEGDGDGESETAAVHASAGRRPKKNPQSRKRTSRDRNLRNEKQKKQKNSKSKKSTKSSSKATSSSSEMSRGGLKSSKDTTTIAVGKSNNPRAGRRTTIPSAVLHGLTSSNQELIRFVSELMSSASHFLPPTLLDTNASPAAAAAAAAGHDDSVRSARRDDDSDRENYNTSHDDDDDDDDDDDSPRGLGGDSGRKRKDTWLTMIPFETPKTEYELERDEILRRHKHQFERLGIVSELIEEPQPPRAIRPYCRRWASEPDPAYQRNTRFQDRQRRTSMQPDRDATSAAAAAMDTRAPIEAYSTSSAPSSVAKFTGGCKLQTSHGASGETAKLEATDTEVSGFQPLDGTWLDPDLNRIYTMDLAPICASSPKTGLLAAGGSQGRLAVFAVSDADSESASRAPLLSWAVDSSWVSQVVFVSNQFQEHGTLLLSSSNDGRVVLWDINKQRVRIGARGFGALAREAIPVVVCESSELHSGGIFGMHEFRGSIATSSDGCVAISILRETGITVDRFIAGHHAGVIRSVRFREQNVLADCGVDTVIGILDLRAADPCTLRIQTTHKTGISMVEWSPVSVDSNLVLSASNDPQLYVHDIRYGAKAMLQLEGHVHPRRVKCYSIYRPTFVAGGDAIVTPGEGTHQLSLYSVTTGSAVKKLHVGYDPNILLWSSAIPSQGGVWAGSRGITKFQALWQQRPSCQVQS